MDIHLALVLVLAAARLKLGHLLGHPSPLAWSWHLGLKADSYGYTLVVLQMQSGEFALQLLRSQGQPTQLRQAMSLREALAIGLTMQREYRKVHRINVQKAMG